MKWLSHGTGICLGFEIWPKGFTKWWTNLHPQQQLMRAVVSPHPRQHLVSYHSFSSSHSGRCVVVVVEFLSRVWLWNPVNYSMPGLPVPHCIPEFAQVSVPWVGYAVQPSHPLPPSSPFAFSLSQHQGLSQWVSSSHQVVQVSELQLQHLFWNSLAFFTIQQMLVPLPFLTPACTSGSSRFKYCCSLPWRILSITLLAWKMSAIVW